MKKPASGPVAVIGPGAIGAFLALRLSQAGPVVLVGRDASWLKAARRRGIRARGVAAPLARIQPVVSPKGPSCEAVFLCVKAGDVPAALKRAKPLVGPGTAVVSLQNGLTHRKHVLAAFGRERSVFGACYIAATRLDRTTVLHRGGAVGGAEVVLARRPGNARALARARSALRGAGIRTATAASEDALLWTKAAFNAAVNPLGALTARANGELASVGPLRELLLRAAGEASGAARASGHRLLYPDLSGPLLKGCLSAPEQKNSMLQDLEAGRPTEAQAILGPFLDAARRSRRPVPTLDALHRFVRRLERELA